jgi:hypothetical protein
VNKFSEEKFPRPLNAYKTRPCWVSLWPRRGVREVSLRVNIENVLIVSLGIKFWGFGVWGLDLGFIGRASGLGFGF